MPGPGSSRIAGASGVQVVWFKRDLRVRDHSPLVEAAADGPLVAIYIYEPDVLTDPYYDASHLRFIEQCLAEVDADLRTLGSMLIRRTGEATTVLASLDRELTPHGGIAALWSHEETGQATTYTRDLRVAQWCRERRIPWHERLQTGVVRRLRTRDGWARRWLDRMKSTPLDAPEYIRSVAGLDSGRPAEPRELSLPDVTRPKALAGGSSRGLRLLDSFLTTRGMDYTRAMSSPLEGWDACSRLSPHLTWGSVSIRQCYHASRDQLSSLRADDRANVEVDPRWFRAISSFEKRLRWRCHFMQKLEDEPDIEFNNMNPAFDGLRDPESDPRLQHAWITGNTGYPLVDACVRALHASGWINFRMRAMLASFAAYHLWQHWKPSADAMAPLFLDFEAGIHFSQFQMQAGVTGINTVRIYSPIKQVADQDPRGEFIKRYVPELEGVPDEFIAEPHRMPLLTQHMAGCIIGSDYPQPIVDHAEAYRAAKDRVFAWKQRPGVRDSSKRVYIKHGSRKSPLRDRLNNKE